MVSYYSSRFSKKTVLIPALAGILFLYGVTSIQAAKNNAKRHRDADTGGEGLSLVNETRRRHGTDRKLEGSSSTLTELASEARSQIMGAKKKDDDGEVEKKAPAGMGRSETEEKLRALRGKSVSSREG